MKSSALGGGGGSYGYHNFVAGKSLGEIKAPTTTILTMDCLSSITDRIMTDLVDSGDFRHNNKLIASYVDGHVELISVVDPPTSPVNWTAFGGGTLEMSDLTNEAGSTLTAATSVYPYDSVYANAATLPISGSGQVSFVFPSSPAGYLYVGLCALADLGTAKDGVEPSSNYQYGLFSPAVYYPGTANVFENGADSGRSISYAAGDKITIKRVGTTLYTYVGTTLADTSTVAISADLYVQATLYQAGDSITNCLIAQ